MSILTRPFGYSATRPDTFLRLARVSLFPVSALCWRSGAAQTGNASRTECAQPAPTASELTVLPPPSITCLTGIRYIRVNVRFVQTATGGDNFGPVDLPVTPFDDNGYRWAQGMIWVANWPGGWSQNTQMRLPVGNSTAVLPKRIQLVLTGGYFDKVPAAYQSTERLWYYLGGPARGEAWVRSPFGAAPATATLFDGLGRVVRTLAVGAAPVRLALSDLPGGVYTVRIGAGGPGATRRLVVQP